MTKRFPIICFLFFGLLFSGGAVFASTTSGTIDSTSKYAWSNNVGWINFAPTNSVSAYAGLTVTDAIITGYAWSENTGWINFNPTNGGVTNNSQGTLSGSAWGEQTGWIDFRSVTIGNTGNFAGTATGDIVGTLNFNCTHCSVTTDWRPASTRSSSSSSSSGGGGGAAVAIASAPTGPLNMVINGNNAYTNHKNVMLSLTASTDVVAMAVSNSPNFSGALQENYTTLKPWTLTAGDGPKTVYVKFYTKNGVASNSVSDTIILDTNGPNLAITNVKNSYSSNQEVVISGVSEANIDIGLIIDQQYGNFKSDGQGNFSITLGVMPQGMHTATFTPVDLAGNIGVAVTVNFSVQNATQLPLIEPPFILAPPLAPILHQLQEGIKNLLPGIFKPIGKSAPVAVVTVPKLAPLAFKTGGDLFPMSPLSRFVLAPLPKDLKLLAQQFPRLGKTFTSVGVNKMTDLQKLRTSNLNLPLLAESVGLPEQSLVTGKFAPAKSLPLAQFSLQLKEKIPSEVVFVKTAGGLMDVNVALSVDNEGMTTQHIKAIVGQPLQLIIKPKYPVVSITGYVVFKSKNPQTLYKIPVSALTASLVFSSPEFSSLALPNRQIALEGVTPTQNSVMMQLPNIEERLVLMTFDYVNSGDGIYTANVTLPVVDGEYEIITTMEYQDKRISDKEIKLTTLVDPEGYIFEKNGSQETRITGAVASLYWLNPVTNKYELWPAKDFQQENPQVTDVRGTYSFLVPNGYYYIKVDAPGYASYHGKPFEVKEGGGVHINIKLKSHAWLLKFFDWKTTLLILVIILLAYNFYRDKKRNKPAARAWRQNYGKK